MTPSDKLREIAEKHKFGYHEYVDHVVSEYTALISENYVERAKYDEAVRQRDELREALAEQKRIYFNLFEEEVRCMYCEAKINRGSAIILCKECAENTEA